MPSVGKAGSYVSISGNNLGQKGSLSRVSFSGQRANTDAQIVSWKDTFIQCKVPQLAAGAYSIKVIDATGQSNNKSFRVQR
jgi:hypothetical protein